MTTETPKQWTKRMWCLSISGIRSVNHIKITGNYLIKWQNYGLIEHLRIEKNVSVSFYNGFNILSSWMYFCTYLFFPGLAHCQSARWKGEVEMWGIINRVWQAASSERSLLMVDWQVEWEGHTCVASVFSLLLVSLGLLSLVLKMSGWDKKKIIHHDLKESDTCLDVSCVVLFI